MYYGLFWVIYMSSTVFGGAVGAAIIGRGREYTFLYVTMTCIAFVASLAFWFIREPLLIVESEDANGNQVLIAS